MDRRDSISMVVQHLFLNDDAERRPQWASHYDFNRAELKVHSVGTE